MISGKCKYIIKMNDVTPCRHLPLSPHTYKRQILIWTCQTRAWAAFGIKVGIRCHLKEILKDLKAWRYCSDVSYSCDSSDKDIQTSKYLSFFLYPLFKELSQNISISVTAISIVMCLLAYLEHNLAVAQPIGPNQPRGVIVSLSPVTVAGPLMTNCSATGSSRGVIIIVGHAFEAMVTQPVSSEWYILSCILHWLYGRGYVCGLIWSLQPLKARAQCPQ